MNPWFCLFTTLIGITVKDCLKGCRYKFDSNITICEFAEQVASELLNNSFSNNVQSIPPMETRSRRRQTESPMKPSRILDCFSAKEDPTIIPMTDQTTLSKAARMEMMWHEFLKIHKQVSNKTVDKEGKTTRFKCSICKVFKTRWKCKECDKAICPDDQGGASRFCCRKHIMNNSPEAGLIL
jgi:hypothetical protein